MSGGQYNPLPGGEGHWRFQYARLNNIYLDYTSITLNFYNSFVNYLMNDLQQFQNTIGKHIQVFKTFMNEATEGILISQRLDRKI